jgi:hypothetical protein
LIRCQNLKAISGISAVGVPDSVRQDWKKPRYNQDGNP